MFFIIFMSVIGLFVGSFLTVISDRFETTRSSVTGRSTCDHCHRPLTVIDLIPVVSFILFFGKCRTCHKPIGLHYIIQELVTGILFGLTAWRYTVPALYPIGFTIDQLAIFLLRDLFFISLLLILFLIDAHKKILPDLFTIPGIILVVAFNLSLGIPLVTILFGALMIGGFFALQFFISHGTWVGDGDIRFGVLLGAMLGFAHGILALGLAYIIGSIYAIVLLLQKQVTRKSELAFGPFLAIAAFIVLLFGSVILQTILGD